MTDFNKSKTKENLMRSFAGESQARNRYTFAAKVAKKEGYTILEDLFTYTANQERAHAWEFMKKLKDFSGEDIEISTSYPVEVETSTLTVLRSAQKHENAEYEHIYHDFANIAKDEGFNDIAGLFTMIASIEKIHSDRFKLYADMLENGSLFKDSAKENWICTNCGYIFEGESAPLKCPACEHPQGYFIRFNASPFEK